MHRTQLCRPAAPRPTLPGVEIRPARLDDEERVRLFVLGLSQETRTRRFFMGMTRPSARMVQAMVARDQMRDALLAVVGDEVVVGHAMSFHKEGTAEIAVVVADEWQNVGIGSRLVRTLLRRAAAGGAEHVGMDVMGGNRKVLSMVRRAWPDAIMRVESGSVEVKAGLTFAEQGSVRPPLAV